MKKSDLKGAYVKINLDNIAHNYHEVKDLFDDQVTVSCVVKSDAYGHGESEVVKTLVEEGLGFICVSTVYEAIRLRNQFPDIQILILGYTPRYLLSQVMTYDLIQTISSLEEAQALSELTRKGSDHHDIHIHIKVNTGMNRLGFDVNEPEEILRLQNFAGISIDGIFSHLHSSDASDKTKAMNQIQAFRDLIQYLEVNQMQVGTKHILNSGGIIDLTDHHMDMVRQGIILYGLYPSQTVDHHKVHLKECMEMISYIAAIRKISPGQGVSYGHSFIAKKPMTIATVNLGYSDGLFRHLSNVGQVIIGDQRRPIVGRVCMNMFMVDVTGMEDIHVEDPVIIFGASDHEHISIDETANMAGTISYDIVCRSGYSLPRVYERFGQIVKVEEPMMFENKKAKMEEHYVS